MGVYTLTISCGPGSVTGRASGGEESTTNKPLGLEITQSIYIYQRVGRLSM